MYKRRKIERRYVVIIILVVATLLLGLFSYSINDNRKLNIIEKSIKDAGLIINKTINVPINFVKDKIDEAKSKHKIYEKYKKLSKKYEKVELMEAKYQESLKEIKELKETLELNKTLSESSYLNASVINRDIGDFYDTMTIDKGSKNGVKKDMAVITNKGLIGRIIKVSNFNSVVKLLTDNDSNSKISVKIKVNENDYVYGLLVGYKEKNKTFIIEGIAENTEIKKGYEVTTTGLGNTFPSGILIGKVKKVSTDNFDLAKTVEVESLVNFDNITYVTILKRNMEK